VDERRGHTPQNDCLYQNYPNPFNPVTTIRFDLAKSRHVRLYVYSIDGSLVKVLVNKRLAAGRHAASWDGSNSYAERVPSGTYFIKLVADGESFIKKATLVR